MLVSQGHSLFVSVISSRLTWLMSLGDNKNSGHLGSDPDLRWLIQLARSVLVVVTRHKCNLLSGPDLNISMTTKNVHRRYNVIVPKREKERGYCNRASGIACYWRREMLRANEKRHRKQSMFSLGFSLVAVVARVSRVVSLFCSLFLFLFLIFSLCLLIFCFSILVSDIKQQQTWLCS